MTHPGSGNTTWIDYPDTSTMVSAARLEAMELGIDATKLTYRAVSASTQALKNEKLYVDATSASVVISQPSTPTTGTRLFVFAVAAPSTNTITLNWTINGDNTGVQLTTGGVGVHITYNGTGWYIDYYTPSISRYGSSRAPASAGVRSGFYDVPTTTYTPNAASMRMIRAYMAQAATGSLINLVCAGDSRTVGYFSGATPSDSWVSRIRSKFTALGVPSAGTGLVMASNNGTAIDSRIVTSGTWNATYPYRAWTASGNTATFTSDVAGTIVEVYYYSNSGTFTVKVGAGAANPVTPAGGTNVAMAQYTGQSVSVGTQITVTATSAAGYLIGFCVRNQTGLLVHSVAYGGATSTMLATTGAVTLQGIISYINPQILGVMIGCNDPTASIAFGTTQTNFNTILQTNNPNPTKYLMCESPNPTYQSGWPAYVSLQYDYADSLNIPLFDINDRWVSSALAQSAGILGSDGIHETIAGSEDIARAMSRMLTA